MKDFKYWDLVVYPHNGNNIYKIVHYDEMDRKFVLAETDNLPIKLRPWDCFSSKYKRVDSSNISSLEKYLDSHGKEEPRLDLIATKTKTTPITIEITNSNWTYIYKFSTKDQNGQDKEWVVESSLLDAKIIEENIL